MSDRARRSRGATRPAVPAGPCLRLDADDAPTGDEELLGGRLRHDHDPERLLAPPRASAHVDRGKPRSSVVPRGGRRRDPLRMLAGEEVDALVLHGRDQREVGCDQVGEELAEGAGVHDRARRTERLAPALRPPRSGSRPAARRSSGFCSSSCPRRTAAASPPGPAPTMRAPTSMRSSGGSVGSATKSAGSNGGVKSAGLAVTTAVAVARARSASGRSRSGRRRPPGRSIRRSERLDPC